MPGIFGTRSGVAQRTVHAPVYPGLDGVPVQQRELALHGGPQPVVRPPGGSPAALSSLPGLSSALPAGAAKRGGDGPARADRDVQHRSAAGLAGGHWGVADPVAGSRRTDQYHSTADAEAVLFVKLYDVGPDGRRTLPGAAVAPVRIGPLASRWCPDRGHRDTGRGGAASPGRTPAGGRRGHDRPRLRAAPAARRVHGVAGSGRSPGRAGGARRAGSGAASGRSARRVGDPHRAGAGARNGRRAAQTPR